MAGEDKGPPPGTGASGRALLEILASLGHNKSTQKAAYPALLGGEVPEARVVLMSHRKVGVAEAGVVPGTRDL